MSSSERHTWSNGFRLNRLHKRIIVITVLVISMLIILLQSFTKEVPERMLENAAAAEQKGDFIKAIAILDELIERNPFKIDAWSAKGKIYYNTGNYVTASSCYTTALEYFPDHPSLLLNRAHAYRKQKRYEDALADLNTALEKNGNDPELHNAKGLVLLDMNNRLGAVWAFDKAIELNPDFARAWHNRGNAYYWMLEDQKAVDDYSKAIELNPKVALYYNNRGLVYFYLNKYSLALDDYNKAIETDPENSAAYLNRSRLYKIFGNQAACDKDVERFKELRKKEESI